MVGKFADLKALAVLATNHRIKQNLKK